MVIWKFNLDVGVNALMVPKGAVTLSADTQQGKLCVWVLCDPQAPKVTRAYYAEMTGFEAERVAGTRFIGTVLLEEGAFVLHVFADEPMPRA